jgi:glycosyltransferase involved in cell wall biosynthesis
MASVRYRCLHMAVALGDLGVENHFFLQPSRIAACADELDALIVFKRLDVMVIAAVATFRQKGKPVFLDLCDDLISSRRQNPCSARMVFSAVLPQIDGLVVPTVAMAEHMTAYAKELGHDDIPLHIIPDIAETKELYLRAAALDAPTVRPAPPPPVANDPPGIPASASSPRRVVWFGNWGSAYANFGVGSLIPLMPFLRTVHETIHPLELVVISNNREVCAAVLDGFGVPYRYREWSAEVVYAELANADMAYITTGTDESSVLKSNNRLLQALAAGVPVVVRGAERLDEFIDCPYVHAAKKGLFAYLGPDRARYRRECMAAAARVLPRYRPERIAAIWHGLLTAERHRPAQGDPPQSRAITFVVDRGSALKHFKRLFPLCAQRDLPIDLIVTAEVLRRHPRLLDICAANQVVPSIQASMPVAAPSRERLALSSCLVLEEGTPGGVLAGLLRTHAEDLGVPVTTTRLLLERLEAGQPADDTGAAESVHQEMLPGPYPQRLDADGSADWVFIIHEKSRGWILDAISREIGSRQPGSWQVVYLPDKLPPARNYFFSHHSLFLRYFQQEPEAFSRSGSFVWYTHPREETPGGIRKLLQAFHHTTQVIFTCSLNRDLWLRRGLDPRRCRVVLGGADPDLFAGHQRGQGGIGLSSSFYERKNPDCLLELLALLPHRQFTLVGRHWERYALFEQMKMSENFRYVTVPYRQYPRYYGEFDVFLSMSTLEGGPIPLLEAMMANAVPVSSYTGFGPDLIRHGENGYLFANDAPAEEIADLLEAAFCLEADVRASVIEYSWDNFSRTIVSLGR